MLISFLENIFYKIYKHNFHETASYAPRNTVFEKYLANLFESFKA